MKILKIRKNDLNFLIKEVSKNIKQGKVLICPTDTVYGLLADATSKKAVKKVFEIKKREKNKPLPVFVKDLKMAKSLARINEKQERFLKKCWPGAVTAVLKSKKGGTIGLRIPDHPFILKIIALSKRSLTGTSANLSGLPASGKIKEVLRQFKKEKPDLVLDAGDLKPAKSSTVIDLTAYPYKILRQ